MQIAKCFCYAAEVTANTSNSPFAMSILQFAIVPRRPCYTWQPSRCFGTKRGVQSPFSQAQPPPAKTQRQVEPGLRTPLTNLAYNGPVTLFESL
ncbi:MAG TPA: DUF1589 domain-containing protein [Rhodopirellula baltica]|uniref:Uncharacterized protein n=1 Tax=Rhodopirellula baltica (strain DSM 10527 / NCIMB 13988 / SH1) TaxID=243090 RepID=Q7UHY2_RHOBA|nr:hypothetical protein RB12877 [Rhodopirellula baltica SH 1]HBE61617.1 DUF1589 domain-containing protein [Rhodopirellula baltica]